MAESSKLRSIKDALQMVNEQAEDEGLWFIPVYISEDYLQQSLRALHEAVELIAKEYKDEI